MTDYTSHADSLFDVGKPILGSVALEARDNVIATAEGSPGAPVVQLQALGKFTAGTTQRYLDSVGDFFDGNQYQTIGFSGTALNINLGGSGVIRLTFDTSSNTVCRVLVNEVQQVAYSGAGSRSVDVTLPVGGWLVLQHYGTGGSTVDNIQLLTNGEPIMRVASQQFVVFS